MPATERRCVPPATIQWTQDVLGNLIATASFLEAARTLTIDNPMVADHSATAWPVCAIARPAEDFPDRQVEVTVETRSAPPSISDAPAL